MAFFRLSVRLIVSLTIAVAVLELCSRIEDTVTDGAPFIGRYDSTIVFTKDKFGVVGRPNAHYTRWTMNSHGYLGPELRWDRERILFIGASETFGFSEPKGMEYPAQLERELNARAGRERFQAVNAAVPGSTLRSHARRMERLISDVQPTIVLIYASPFDYADRTNGIDNADWVDNSGGFQSHLWTKFFNWLASGPEWFETIRFKVHIWRIVHSQHKPVMQRVPEENIESFRTDLCDLLDRVQARGIRAVLVTHATPFGKQNRPEGYSRLIAMRRFNPMLAEPGFVDLENRINDVQRQEASRRGLTLADAAEQISGPKNFVDHEHFSVNGARLMADLIADKLLPAGSRRAAGLVARRD
jgi:lysophospholipase L1-like esterase